MMTNPSVLAPLGMAFQTVKRVLFQPFDLVKWLVIGFTAWLAFLGSGGSGFNGFAHFPSKHANATLFSQGGHAAWAWINANLFLIIPLVFVVGLISVVVFLLVYWLGCRGKFMFLDNVVGNRAEIIEPWHKFRKQGNSCFLFLICFSLVATALFVIAIGLAVLISWPDLSRSHFGWYSVLAVGFGSVFLLCFMITVGCIRLFLEDFVIPIMALRNCRVMEGWNVFLELFRKHAGMFVLYLLFRLALGMLIGFLVILVCCLLCCTVLIPYVGTVILLPVYVFLRSYSVHFLGQFSENLKMMGADQSSYIFLKHEER